jgi:hypothetical protein
VSRGQETRTTECLFSVLYLYSCFLFLSLSFLGQHDNGDDEKANEQRHKLEKRTQREKDRQHTNHNEEDERPVKLHCQRKAANISPLADVSSSMLLNFDVSDNLRRFEGGSKSGVMDVQVLPLALNSAWCFLSASLKSLP